MFYSLKKKIINKAIAKRNKNSTFDFIAAENYSLKDVNDPLINNSYYFSAHDKEMSIFCRLGERCNILETWFVILYKGEIYSLKEELFEVGKSPLTISKKDDKWHISFKGILNAEDKIEFEADFNSEEKPLNFSSDMPSIRMAIGMANEKWKKEFFSDLDNIQGQTHYEQMGVLNGHFILNGDKQDFSLPCVRDHSFGKRVWDYMNNHLWLMGVSSTSQFNYSLVSYPVMTLLEVGNYYFDNKQHYSLEAYNDLSDINKGEVPSSLSLKVRLDNKQIIEVKVNVLHTITYKFERGKYILHENIAEYDINGDKMRGILEIGFNADKDRYFNNRDIRKLKRK